MFATAALGAGCILHGGNDEQKNELLPKVASGELLLALALEETPHHNPYGAEMAVEQAGESYVVSGSKKFVLDGHVANKIIVVARSSGKAGDREGLTLVLVDSGADGVDVTRTIMAASMAKHMGVPTVIARVQNPILRLIFTSNENHYSWRGYRW